VSPLPSHQTIAHQRLRCHTHPHRPIHHPVTERFKCRPSSTLRHLQVDSSRLEFPTRCILKPWTSLLRHILTRPSLRLCSMLIPPPGCRSRLMSCMASARHSYTTTQPGLMPCIPIGLLDSHVFPFLCFFSLLPFSFLVLYFIGSRLSNIWIGDTMPLCLPSHELYSVHTMFLFGCSVNCVPYIRTYQTSTTYLLMRSHSVFDGITHAWHLLLAFIVLELYLVADVHIYPLNRTS